MKINNTNNNREWNLDFGRLTVRIAAAQFAIYWDFEPLINLEW